jgi:pantothenate synthetase
VDASSLEQVHEITAHGLIAAAVFFGKTRLIDNVELP